MHSIANKLYANAMTLVLVAIGMIVVLVGMDGLFDSDSAKLSVVVFYATITLVGTILITAGVVCSILISLVESVKR